MQKFTIATALQTLCSQPCTEIPRNRFHATSILGNRVVLDVATLMADKVEAAAEVGTRPHRDFV